MYKAPPTVPPCPWTLSLKSLHCRRNSKGQTIVVTGRSLLLQVFFLMSLERVKVEVYFVFPSAVCLPAKSLQLCPTLRPHGL